MIAGKLFKILPSPQRERDRDRGERERGTRWRERERRREEFAVKIEKWSKFFQLLGISNRGAATTNI